jgi:hypothetical protein
VEEIGPVSLEAQPTNTKSVHSRNVNNSSLNDMFQVGAPVFRRIMAELSEVESEEDRLITVTKIVLKLVKQKYARVHRPLDP